MTITIGIAGFGNHALRRILPVIEGDSRLQLGAVWTRRATSQAFLRGKGCTAVTADFTEFLTMPLDVVYVATPSGLHCDHASAALSAGHHAWVEKPVATALDEVRELVELAASQGRMLSEAFMFPWHAQALAIKQLLAAETVGALRQVTLTFCFPHLAPDDFRYDPTLGGGALLDHGCYLVKALDFYLGGEWTVLGGCMQTAAHQVDVSGSALLRRATDGTIASLHWGFGSSYVNEIQFVGERGRILVESAFTKPASRCCDITLEDVQGKRSTIEVKREDPYARMLDVFVQQLARPAEWPRIRNEMLRHAETFFALRSQLKNCT